MEEEKKESVSSSSVFELPVVDFSSFLASPSELEDLMKSNHTASEAQLATAKAIDKSNKEHGFVCLRNSGVPRNATRATFEASRSLFVGMEESSKAKLKKLDTKTNTGYASFGSEALNRRRLPDSKEAFNIRGNSAEWGDFLGTPPGFQEAGEAFWDEMTLLALRYSVCCAVALGLDYDYFSKTFAKMDLCTLRLLHYPPCIDETNETGEENPTSAIRVGEHTDFGSFTFLSIDNIQDESSLGLQVKAVAGGDLGKGSIIDRDEEAFMEGWNDIVFNEALLQDIAKDETSALIVNTGALMARWTNDVWNATAHRVIVSPKAMNFHRYSIAMFCDPDRETMVSVHPNFVSSSDDGGAGEAKYPPIKSIDYLLMKLREAQGVDEEEKDN